MRLIWCCLTLSILWTLTYLVGARLVEYRPQEDQFQIYEKPGKAAILALEQTLAEVHLTDDGAALQKCRLYEIDSTEDEQKVISEVRLPKVKVSLNEMLRIIEECKVFSTNDTSDEVTDEVSHNETHNTDGEKRVSTESSVEGSRPWVAFTGILPGTKWCGMGDIAQHYEELGPRRELDRCCRAHDHCPVKLKALRAGWGLVNFSLYTKSHCECDSQFYNCLKETNTKLSGVLGNFYFNIMKVQCMKPQRTMVCSEKIVSLEGSSQCIRWKYASETLKMTFINPEKRF